MSHRRVTVRRPPPHLPILVCLIALFMLPPTVGADILEQVLVKVNGDIITKTELEARQIAYVRQRRQSGDLGEVKTDEQLQQVLAEALPRLIVDAVNELLLVQRGHELGFKMEDGDFTKIIDKIKKQNNIESEEQFSAALAREGMTMEDLRRAMTRQFLVSRVRQVDILRNVTMTEVEAQEYYDSHPDEYRTPGRVTLREILIAAPKGGAAGATDHQLDTAGGQRLKAKVDTVRRRVLGGESFATVAAEVSDAPSKANGGLIGPLDDEDLAPSVREVLAQMKVGDVSEPLRTPLGYQLLQLEAFTEATRVPFEEVRDDISNRVFNERRKAEYAKYMARLRDEAIIEWKSESLKRAYESYLNSEKPAPAPGS